MGRPHIPVGYLVNPVRAAANQWRPIPTMSTQPEQVGGGPEPGLSAVMSERRRLINLA